MLSKKEIKNSKRNAKRVLETDPLTSTIDFQYVDISNLLEYIEHLESREQKLTEKLENRIKELNNKSGGNTFHVQSIINAEKRENEEILKILKGENDAKI